MLPRTDVGAHDNAVAELRVPLNVLCLVVSPRTTFPVPPSAEGVHRAPTTAVSPTTMLEAWSRKSPGPRVAAASLLLGGTERSERRI